MESLTVANAVSAVRAALDELQPNESYMAGVQDTDNEDLDTIITSKLLEAVALVHANADRTLLLPDAPTIMPASLEYGGSSVEMHKIIVIPIEQDMLRFLALKTKDSDHTVTRIYEQGSDVAMRQADLYTCGTYERPVAVLTRGASQNKILYYKAAQPSWSYYNPSSVIDTLSYLRYPSLSDNAVQVCALVKDAVISMLTGLVLTVYKDPAADAFFSQARLQMGLQEKG